jgi:hypothetical protein
MVVTGDQDAAAAVNDLHLRAQRLLQVIHSPSASPADRLEE